jgi:cytochrome c peroxidase
MRITPLLLFLAACTESSSSPLDPSAYHYGESLPAHFAGAIDNAPSDNPITDDGAALGRVLFHDVALSSDGTIACASCHVQANGFSDTVALSEGVAGETARNAMPIADTRFYRDGRMFWDERAATLEDQVLMPIQNPVEMGLTLDEMVANVSAQPYYADLFTAAFGDSQVTADRVSRALAQYVRAIMSYRSRYDEGIEAAGDVAATFPNYTAAESRGKELFLQACASCHLDAGPPAPGPRRNQAVFEIAVPTNNGLDATNDGDGGVGDITGDPRDAGRFKAPSLRNVALTAPYMHDGRFATLAEVVDHYADGVEDNPNLDPRLRVPGTTAVRTLALSLDDRAALVAFMETLTDDALVNDVRFSDPFATP